jgi:hypothetical protein
MECQRVRDVLRSLPGAGNFLWPDQLGYQVTYEIGHSFEEETMTYNRKLATFTTFLIAAALMPTRALAACDATTIAGNYGYRHNALFAPSTPRAFLPIGSYTPAAVTGRIVFDPTTTPPGISGSRVGNSGGQLTTHTFSGTYSVNSDCTGTVHQVLDDGEVRDYEIAIVQGGAEIEFANTRASPLPVIGGGIAKKAPATCDATTIAGGYGLRSNLLFTSAPIQPHAFLHLDAFEAGALAGQIVFDSTTTPPSISGFRAGNTGGQPLSSTTFIGTYSVSSDCTGTVNQVFPEPNFEQVRQYAIAIVEGGVEIEFADTIVSSLSGSPIFQIVGEGVAKKQ